MQPDSAKCLRALARAVFGRGGSIDAAGDLLDQAILATPAKQRPYFQVKRSLALAILQGDFTTAEGVYRLAETSLRDTKNEENQEDIAETAMRMELELQHSRAVDGIADSFAARRDAWNRDDFFDFSIVSPRMKYVAGTMDRRAFAMARDEWLANQKKRERVESRAYEWLMAYVDAVVTDEDALDALRVQASFGELVDPLNRDAEMDTAIGYAYLRAGRLDEARRFLQRAAHSCRALDLPIAHTRANFYLGEILERDGNIAGACGAYAVVLSRWGASKESSTVVHARDRVEHLGCAGERRDASAH